MAIRLAVLDDGLFVRTYADTLHPVAATFHRFVEAVARHGAFGPVRYLVPVRRLRIWEPDPLLPAVDEALLEVVPTASFAGIADYLLRAPYLLPRNWRPVNEAIADADLVWLRLPASNAPLALIAARERGVPHFSWVAGSVSDVARAQPRPQPLKWLAEAVGAAYEEVERSAAATGPIVNLGGELFNSVFTAAQVERSHWLGPAAEGPPWRLAWAGRMGREKGLSTLFAAVRSLLESGLEIELLLVGDGPERQRVEQMAASLTAGTVRMAGYVGDPNQYLDLLRGTHLLVHPSDAEAVPKVVGESMAAGLPVVATDVGAVRDLLGAGERGRLLAAGDAPALADAIRTLLADPGQRRQLRDRGLAWAADHTAERQAERMVSWLRDQFPNLAW